MITFTIFGSGAMATAIAGVLTEGGATADRQLSSHRAGRRPALLEGPEGFQHQLRGHPELQSRRL